MGYRCRQAWAIMGDGSQVHVAAELNVPGTAICISLAEVFAELDEMQSLG